MTGWCVPHRSDERAVPAAATAFPRACRAASFGVTGRGRAMRSIAIGMCSDSPAFFSLVTHAPTAPGDEARQRTQAVTWSQYILQLQRSFLSGEDAWHS